MRIIQAKPKWDAIRTETISIMAAMNVHRFVHAIAVHHLSFSKNSLSSLIAL